MCYDYRPCTQVFHPARFLQNSEKFKLAIISFFVFAGVGLVAQKTFKFTTKPSTFENANELCSELFNAQIGRIETENEMKLVTEMMNDSHIDYLWLALKKKRHFTNSRLDQGKCLRVNSSEEVLKNLFWTVGNGSVKMPTDALVIDINDCDKMCLLLKHQRVNSMEDMYLLDVSCNDIKYQVLCESETIEKFFAMFSHLINYRIMFFCSSP